MLAYLFFFFLLREISASMFLCIMCEGLVEKMGGFAETEIKGKSLRNDRMRICSVCKKQRRRKVAVSKIESRWICESETEHLANRKIG